jgi:hypothetical protein
MNEDGIILGITHLLLIYLFIDYLTTDAFLVTQTVLGQIKERKVNYEVEKSQSG